MLLLFLRAGKEALLPEKEKSCNFVLLILVLAMRFLYQFLCWDRYASVDKPKMAGKLFSAFWLIFVGQLAAMAQETHLSQQYAGRLLLNPAFAGAAQADMSAVVSYRNQWPALSGGFVTNQLSADYRFKDQGSALGLVASVDRAGRAGFSRLQLGGIYAYHLNFGELSFSGGLQGTYGSQRVDFNALVFGDQLDDDGRVRNTTMEANLFEPVSYLSVSAGGLLYNNSFWLGVAAYHLNRPDIGFATVSELPLKLVANTGYKFSLRSYYENNKLHEFSLTPTITYTRQQEFHKTDLAMYTTYTPMTLGVLYRGIPLGQSLGYDRSIALIVGVMVKFFKMGYSYDLTVAGFGASTGGAHELSLTFEKVDYDKLFKKRQSRKNYNQIACPAF